jgi:hypothetical protein
MKITKTFISVFFLTFLIGTIGYFIIPKTDKNIEQKEIVQLVSMDLPAPKIETKVQPNVFDIENFWDDTEGKHNTNFLETGEVSNGEDIKAKSGETWFGLFNESGKDVLRPTKIKVKTIQEEGIWKEVSVRDKENPIFLLKDKKKLKTGEVKTLYREKTWRENDDFNDSATIKDGFNKKFYLGNVEYTLRVEKGISTKQESLLVLLLETETTSQVIHFIYYMEEADYVGNLYWVGDLDRDGKLDLYMDFYGYEKGGYSSGLFLSSEAEKGKLVNKSEYFMLGGC